MTAFARSWLVMATVALLPHWSWAQDAQFEGFAPGWGVQYNAGHQPSYTAPGPEYELLPDNRSPWYDFDSQFELVLDDIVEGSGVKVEYLSGSFQRPGNALLGAPLGSVPNPRERFNVSAGAVIDAQAIVPDTSPLQLDAQSGVRTTISLNAFRDFSLEASYVGMQDMRSAFQLVPSGLDPDDFPDAVRFYATSVLDSGAVGSRVILYDRLYEADYKAQYWSGEVNVLFNNNSPNTGYRMRPLLGFRFNAYDEDLVQHGEFDNSSGVDATLGTLTTPERNTIRSSTRNNYYLGQVGFQAELVDKWFTIGVAPKIGMGTNTIQNNVFTSDLRDSADIVDIVDDGITSASRNSVIFGSNLDLNAYLKIRVNPWLSLTGSAFYWYMPNVARAHDTLVYDDNGIGGPIVVPPDPLNPPIPPAFRPRIHTQGLGIHGFTVGAEITF